VNLIGPGRAARRVRDSLMRTYASEASSRVAEAQASTFGIQTFVSIVPRNPVKAAADLDMLGLIFFSLIFGAALTLIPKEKADPVIKLLDGLGEAVVRIIGMSLSLAPYGVFG
jgi:DAACS family dicarboxylate/amino acid:cation (Na+ or H+) symporter